MKNGINHTEEGEEYVLRFLVSKSGDGKYSFKIIDIDTEEELAWSMAFDAKPECVRLIRAILEEDLKSAGVFDIDVDDGINL